MFEKPINWLVERPLIPFAFGGIIGLCVSVYFGRKLTKEN